MIDRPKVKRISTCPNPGRKPVHQGTGPLLYAGRYELYFAAPKWRLHRKRRTRACDRRGDRSHALFGQAGPRPVWTIGDFEQKQLPLKQENVLPKGRIDRKWGSLAFDIALAIRPQIVEAVRRLRDPQPHGLAVPPALR